MCTVSSESPCESQPRVTPWLDLEDGTMFAAFITLTVVSLLRELEAERIHSLSVATMN